LKWGSYEGKKGVGVTQSPTRKKKILIDREYQIAERSRTREKEKEG